VPSLVRSCVEQQVQNRKSHIWCNISHTFPSAAHVDSVALWSDSSAAAPRSLWCNKSRNVCWVHIKRSHTMLTACLTVALRRCCYALIKLLMLLRPENTQQFPVYSSIVSSLIVIYLLSWTGLLHSDDIKTFKKKPMSLEPLSPQLKRWWPVNRSHVCTSLCRTTTGGHSNASCSFLKHSGAI